MQVKLSSKVKHLWISQSIVFQLIPNKVYLYTNTFATWRGFERVNIFDILICFWYQYYRSLPLSFVSQVFSRGGGGGGGGGRLDINGCRYCRIITATTNVSVSLFQIIKRRNNKELIYCDRPKVMPTPRYVLYFTVKHN